jgi:transcriptional regulator with XRE-family HTH domain
MTFLEYIRQSGKDFVEVAGELGISKAYVGQLASKKTTPGMRLAYRIFLWSNLQIRMESWLADGGAAS